MNVSGSVSVLTRLAGMVVCAFIGAALFTTWQRNGTIPANAVRADQPQPKGDSWLTGTTEEKFAKVEKHLRGLDVAMAEIGYRYGELHHAARARNWEYAQYQAEKIDLSLRLAIERRPKRAKSSQPFLNEVLPLVLGAARKKDGKALDEALVKLHDSCVQCHKEEKVLHFKESVERIRDRARN